MNKEVLYHELLGDAVVHGELARGGLIVWLLALSVPGETRPRLLCIAHRVTLARVYTQDSGHTVISNIS